VDVGVLLHVGFLVEALAAERTGERSDVAVDQQVRGQRRRSLELFVADAASELPRRRRRRGSATFRRLRLRSHPPCRPGSTRRRHKSARLTSSFVVVATRVAGSRRMGTAPRSARSVRLPVRRVEERVPDFCPILIPVRFRCH